MSAVMDLGKEQRSGESETVPAKIIHGRRYDQAPDCAPSSPYHLAHTRSRYGSTACVALPIRH
jgi:hypothetical protein